MLPAHIIESPTAPVTTPLRVPSATFSFPWTKPQLPGSSAPTQPSPDPAQGRAESPTFQVPRSDDDRCPDDSESCPKSDPTIFPGPIAAPLVQTSPPPETQTTSIKAYASPKITAPTLPLATTFGRPDQIANPLAAPPKRSDPPPLI